MASEREHPQNKRRILYELMTRVTGGGSPLFLMASLQLLFDPGC